MNGETANEIPAAADADYEASKRDASWCYVCDRPKNDCACEENGGNY